MTERCPYCTDAPCSCGLTNPSVCPRCGSNHPLANGCWAVKITCPGCNKPILANQRAKLDKPNAWHPICWTKAHTPTPERATSPEPLCPKCSQPMKEMDTWTDVHHFVCTDCRTEKTPIRRDTPASPGGEPAPQCMFCQQKLEWQGRYEGWDCCCQGYWFATNTGSACPKSDNGHWPENADLRRQLALWEERAKAINDNWQQALTEVRKRIQELESKNE